MGFNYSIIIITIIAFLVALVASQLDSEAEPDAGRYSDFVLRDFKWAIRNRQMDIDLYQRDDDFPLTRLTECRIYTTTRPLEEVPCQNEEFAISFKQPGYQPYESFTIILKHKPAQDSKSEYKKEFVIEPIYFGCPTCEAYPKLPAEQKKEGSSLGSIIQGILNIFGGGGDGEKKQR